jgi:hypothetical protein
MSEGTLSGSAKRLPARQDLHSVSGCSIEARSQPFDGCRE